MAMAASCCRRNALHEVPSLWFENEETLTYLQNLLLDSIEVYLGGVNDPSQHFATESMGL